METSSTFSSPHTLWRAGGMNTLLDSSRKRISSPHHILNVYILCPGQPGSVHSRSTCSRRYCHPVQADCQQRVLITDSTWTYVAPVNLGVYSAAALAAGGNVTQCTVHTNHQQSQGQTVELHCVFRAQEASNDLTFYGIGDDALAALNNQLINFKYASTTQC